LRPAVTAGQPSHGLPPPRRPGLGATGPLGHAGLVASGQVAAANSSAAVAATRSGAEGAADAARGHSDTAIGAGLMASMGAWRPERPERPPPQATAQAPSAGAPSSHRPCIGRLAHHIILQPERANLQTLSAGDSSGNNLPALSAYSGGPSATQAAAATELAGLI
jgi:hypothetical protein